MIITISFEAAPFLNIPRFINAVNTATSGEIQFNFLNLTKTCGRKPPCQVGENVTWKDRGNKLPVLYYNRQQVYKENCVGKNKVDVMELSQQRLGAQIGELCCSLVSRDMCLHILFRQGL